VPIKLNPDQTITELQRRGVELEPNEKSTTGFALKVGPTGAALPDWLLSNLTANSGDIAVRFGKKVKGGLA